MSKKIIFIFAFLILFSNIIFALDTTITPEYNGTQPFVRPMAGGQVHITWDRPSDTTNFHKILRIREIFYELQFKKGTDTTWYQYFPGGSGNVTDSTSINDPETFKIDADSFDTSNSNAQEGDKKGPNYYGFGVDTTTLYDSAGNVNRDLNRHYLIHILTYETASDTTSPALFSYADNVAKSKSSPPNPNTYFYRIRSRVEDSFNSVEVSPWFPNEAGDSVTINIFPESGKPLYFYNDKTIDTTFLVDSNRFAFQNKVNWVIPCYLLSRDANSYIFSYNPFDPDTTIISKAFEEGKDNTYNTTGIYNQIQAVFGAVNLNKDGDDHISIVRIPLNEIWGYFSINLIYPPNNSANFTRVSNFREMIFISNSISNINLKATMAHEFQHLIHKGYDFNEITWVNEGCSGLAQDICGYFEPNDLGVKNFTLKNGNEQLYPWDINLDNRYGITALWTMLLQEKFGRASIKEYVKNTAVGINVFYNGGPFGDVKFDSAFQEWTLMNYLNDTAFLPLDTSFVDYHYSKVNDDYVRNSFSIKSYPYIYFNSSDYCSTIAQVDLNYSSDTIAPSCGNYLSWEYESTKTEMFKVWVKGDLLNYANASESKDYYYVLEKYDSTKKTVKAEKNKVVLEGNGSLKLSVNNFGVDWNKVTLILTNKNDTSLNYEYTRFFARGELYETTKPTVKVYDKYDSLIDDGGFIIDTTGIKIEVKEDKPEDSGIDKLEIRKDYYDTGALIFEDTTDYGTSHVYESVSIGSQGDGKIYVRVWDKAGNQDSTYLIFDTTLPEVSEIFPADSTITDMNDQDISATISDAGGILIDSIKIIINGNEKIVEKSTGDDFVVDIRYQPNTADLLYEGENKWSVIGNDLAGNDINDSTHILIVDTKSPKVESYSVEKE